MASVVTSVGVQLDLIGEMIDLDRGGLSDDLYRLAIITEATTLFTSGTAPEILEMARVMFPDAPTIRYTPAYPAKFCVRIDELTADEFGLIVAIFEDVPAAGVAGCLISSDPLTMGGWAFAGAPAETENMGAFGFAGGDPADQDFILSPWTYGAQFGS